MINSLNNHMLNENDVVIMQDFPDKSMVNCKIGEDCLNKSHAEICNIIQETLIYNSDMDYTKEFIDKLCEECIKNNVLFVGLVDNLNCESINKLGKALIDSNHNNKSAVILMFFKNILLLKVCS